MLNRVLLVHPQLVLPVATKLVRLDPDSVVGLRRCDPLNRQIGQGEARRVVEAKHRPRGSGGTLLDIAEDVEPGSANVGLAGEEETGNVFGVAVEVDNDGLVGGEEGGKGLFSEGVGVGADLAENKEVVDIDDPDPETFLAEDGRGGDDFECHFDTAADEHDVRVDTVVGRVPGPNGRAGDAVTFRLVDREPGGTGVLGADNQADI